MQNFVFTANQKEGEEKDCVGPVEGQEGARDQESGQSPVREEGKELWHW